MLNQMTNTAVVQNQDKSIYQGTFSHLPSLISLSLEQNPLKSLSPALLTPTLQVILLILPTPTPHSR